MWIGPEDAQCQHPDRNRGHPVRVVVAPDGDPLPRIDRAFDTFERNRSIGHEQRVVE